MGHLLLVDNDPDILELLAIGLMEDGYEVVTAQSGVEALRAIEASIPDVLITDLIMPNIDGEKLLRIVHSMPEWHTIKTIVVSGVAIEAPDLRKRTPCDIYIAKGPIASTLQYIRDSLRNFERMTEMARTNTIGLDGIYSRHITRELLDFKEDVDQILNHISDGVCKLNDSNVVVWLNRSFARMVGTTEEAILGKPLSAILEERENEAVVNLAHSPPDSEHRVIEVSLDRTRIARATLLYSFDEDAGYAAILWEDVTERLLLEEQYENIVESANDVVWTTDLSGVFTYVSRASQRIIGVDPQELVGTYLWDAAHEEDRNGLSQAIQDLLTRAREGDLDTLTVSDWRFRSSPHCTFAPTAVRWAQSRTSALKDRAGRTIGLQGTLSDTTDQRALEDEKDALLHEVHHRVRDNLQLIGSLTRLNDPDALESRISTLGEVFDELYRERSFSEISARPLLERVTHTSIANSRCTSVGRTTLEISLPTIEMRRAVPLALLVNELVQELCDATPETPVHHLLVGLRPERSGGVLTVEISRSGFDANRLPDEDTVTSLQDDRLAFLLTEQLRGSATYHERNGTGRYIITFP
ncbi:MAG: PAS domain-containing protein [Alkalispirochaeta sp.]